jgi:hypothetical protein
MIVALWVALVQEPPKPVRDDWELRMDRKGGISSGGKTLVDPKAAHDLSPVESVLVERAGDDRYSWGPRENRRARYRVFIATDAETPVFAVFRLIETAWLRGGVTNQFLATTEDFGDFVEISLPVDRGLGGRASLDLPIQLTERGAVWIASRYGDTLKGDRAERTKQLRESVLRAKTLQEQAQKAAGDDFAVRIALDPDEGCGFRTFLDALALARESGADFRVRRLLLLVDSAAKR